MDKFNKVKDLTQVFDERWKANHSVNVKKARDNEKKFNDKMFGSSNVFKRNIDNSVSGRVDRLQKQINNTNEVNRIGKMIDFKNNFR